MEGADTRRRGKTGGGGGGGGGERKNRTGISGDDLMSDAGNRSDVDDAGRVSEGPRLLQEGQTGLGEVEERLDVDVHALVPALLLVFVLRGKEGRKEGRGG